MRAEAARAGGAPADRQALIGILATLCAALMVAVVIASAYLRLANAGLGCADWPACYGTLAAAEPAGKAGGMDAMRVVHRIAATSSLLLVLGLVWLTLARRPALRREGVVAGLLLALALGLAGLGWVARSSTLPAVVLANLLGGFAMLALAWRLRGMSYAGARWRLPNGTAARPWVRLGLFALLAEIVVGGLIGADFAARSCLSLPACGDTWWPAGPAGHVLQVMRDFAGAPLAEGDAGGIALHMLHRVLAVASALILGIAAFRAIALPPALAVVLLVFGNMIVGAASIKLGLPLLGVVLHNLLAALLLAATVSLLDWLRG